MNGRNSAPDDSATESVVNRWRQLDISEVLRGCSIPIYIGHLEDGGLDYTFAITDVEPWPRQKLTQQEQSQLAGHISATLAGLKSMHGQKFFYGRISDETFCRRINDPEQKPVVVVDPRLIERSTEVIGGHPEEKYWLHGRIERRRPTTATDDLYALGIVLTELLIGRAGVDSIWRRYPDKTFPDQLQANVRASKADYQLKRLACWLIGSAVNPKRTADGAISYLRHVGLRKSRLMKAVIVTVALTLLGLAYVSSNRTRQRLETKIESLSNDLTDEKNNVASRDKGIKERDTQIQVLTQTIKEREQVGRTYPPSPDPTDELKTVWKSSIASSTIEETVQTADKWLQENKTSGDRKYIEQWRDSLKPLISGDPLNLAEWCKVEDDLRSLVSPFIHTPWSDQGEIKKIREHATALNAAYSTWREWAASDKTFDELKELQKLMRSGTQKDALGKWLAEVIGLKNPTFVISSGTTTVPWAIEHLVSIRSGVGSWSTKPWVWNSPGSSGTASVTISLTGYSPGDPIEVLLEQDGYTYDTDIVIHTFGGPLAPWKWKRETQQPLRMNNYEIFIELIPEDFVGPPHLSDNPSELLTPTAQEVAKPQAVPDTPTAGKKNKEIYDPVGEVLRQRQ